MASTGIAIRRGADSAEAPNSSARPLKAHAHVALVSSLRELEALGPQWRHLQAEAGISHGVFQSHEWSVAWARTYAAPDTQLRIVTGYNDGKLVFIWPLRLCGGGLVKTLCWLTDPFGQYGDIIIAPGEDTAGWMREAWSFLRKLKDVDLIRLRHVRQDAVGRPFLAAAFRSAKSEDGAPSLNLSQFADEAAYEARYSKDQRKRRKRIRKDLEERGPVEFRLLDGLCKDVAMRDALAEKRKWIEERNLWSSGLGCPKLLDFLLELRRASTPGMQLVVSQLTAGEQRISWEVGLRFNGRHCGFITAHVNQLTDASPARLHMDLSQRQALKDGMKVFDLMVPNDAHKNSWSDSVTPVQDFYAAASLKGVLYGHIYLEALRPVMRHTYYNAPAALRPFLTSIVNLRRAISGKG